MRSLVLTHCVAWLIAASVRGAETPPVGDAQRAALAQLAERASRELHDDILPFWTEHVRNPAGGFFGEVRSDGSVNPAAPRGALMTCRILWTFSAAFRRDPRAEYREMADRALEDLLQHFWDAQHGGLFWTVRPDGSPLIQHKQVYLQAFGIYALAEYRLATGDTRALDRAQALFRLLESHARDSRHGGYFEAFSRDWSRELPEMRRMIGGTAPKSQNTHLHMMEAYANLLRAWPDPEPRDATRALIELMFDRILHPTTHHLGLYFTSDWQPASKAVSYGHDIEASWLLCEATEALGDERLRARARDTAIVIARTVLAEGVTPLGGIAFEGGPAGITQGSHEWWSQAEGVVGFLNAYVISRDPAFLQAAGRTWDFIDAHVIDHANGEWFLMLDPEGRPLSNRAKAGLWKCPYHNGRACMEIAGRAADLLAR